MTGTQLSSRNVLQRCTYTPIPFGYVNLLLGPCNSHLLLLLSMKYRKVFTWVSHSLKYQNLNEYRYPIIPYFIHLRFFIAGVMDVLALIFLTTQFIWFFIISASQIVFNWINSCWYYDSIWYLVSSSIKPIPLFEANNYYKSSVTSC